MIFHFWQVVKFFDFRHIDFGHTNTVPANLFDHFRQPVIGLGAKHDINIRCTLLNALTFLLTDTATNTDNHIGAFVFQFFITPQFRIYFFLGLFAYRACVHQNHIGIFRHSHQPKTIGFFHHIGHA